jgi:hypothetical protein
MFCLTSPGTLRSEAPPRGLNSHQYLSHLQDQIRQKRIALHKADDPSIEYTIKDGILQFNAPANIKNKLLALLKRGFSEKDVADLLFTPQIVEGGREWQQAVLAGHEEHLLAIAEKVRRSLYDHAENPVSQQLISTAAIGLADVPLVFPYTTSAPAGGSVVIIPRALIIIPMWFAALRRLPRPWNELPFEGEPLRRLLGTAGVAIKAMMGLTMIGTNTYMYELLHSEEMKIGFGGDDFSMNWKASSELAEFGRRHETTLCERFAIAHELAHVALGHTEIARAMQRLGRSNDGKQAQWMRRAEFEADELALQVLLDLSPAARGTMMDYQHVFNGHQILDALLVLFLLFHVVEDHKAMAQPAASHPPAQERLRRLIELLVGDPEGRKRFFDEIYPQITQDQEVLDAMLGTAIRLAKPKVVSHPDGRMRWL